MFSLLAFLPAVTEEYPYATMPVSTDDLHWRLSLKRAARTAAIFRRQAIEKEMASCAMSSP